MCPYLSSVLAFMWWKVSKSLLSNTFNTTCYFITLKLPRNAPWAMGIHSWEHSWLYLKVSCRKRTEDSWGKLARVSHINVILHIQRNADIIDNRELFLITLQSRNQNCWDMGVLLHPSLLHSSLQQLVINTLQVKFLSKKVSNIQQVE